MFYNLGARSWNIHILIHHRAHAAGTFFLLFSLYSPMEYIDIYSRTGLHVKYVEAFVVVSYVQRQLWAETCTF